MSARDNLDRYQEESQYCHPSKGECAWYSTLDEDPKLMLQNMPDLLKGRIMKLLVPIATQLAREEHPKLLAELRARAVAEAQETLAELTGDAQPKPVVYHEPQAVEAEP